jgi:hypothetical protein
VDWCSRVELNNPGAGSGGVGESVTSTSFYGPDSDALGNITAVGCYTTLESGAKQIGLLYQGTVAGVGMWTTLTPPEDLFPSVENTIAHSTMGGLVVGNTISQAQPFLAILKVLQEMIMVGIIWLQMLKVLVPY